MPEYITDNDGKWEITGKRGRSRALVEPSAEWIAARKAESEAAERARAAARAAALAAEKAALEALASPLVDRVEGVLQARGLSGLATEERGAMQDAAVYLSSRGKYGKA